MTEAMTAMSVAYAMSKTCCRAVLIGGGADRGGGAPSNLRQGNIGSFCPYGSLQRHGADWVISDGIHIKDSRSDPRLAMCASG